MSNTKNCMSAITVRGNVHQIKMWYCDCSFHGIRCLIKCHSKTPISSFPSWLINICSWPFQWIGATLSWKSRLRNYVSKQIDYWSADWRRESLANCSDCSDPGWGQLMRKDVRLRYRCSSIMWWSKYCFPLGSLCLLYLLGKMDRDWKEFPKHKASEIKEWHK